MANQMIALGVRGPQTPDLGAAMSQQANMMANMAVARERQGVAQRAAAFRELVGSEGFDPSNPAHIRAASALDPAGSADIAQAYDRRRAAGQTFDVAEMGRLRNLGTSVVDNQTYQAWLGEVERSDPRSAAMFRQASPEYNPDFMNRLMMEAEQFINKSIPTPNASVQYTPGGDAYAVNIGGMRPPTAEEVTVVPPRAEPPVGMAPTPAPQQLMPNAGVDARATRGAQTGPQDLLDQGVNPASIPSGNPLQRPISMTTGGQGPQPLTMESAPQIIQNAVQNRTIDESHLQQLRQMVGPENEQALAQWMQQNGVRIQPAGQPTMRSAVYRPGQDAAPQMTQVQQTVNAPGTQFRGRDPTIGQYPGSALVPIPRVREEAEANRETPEQAARRRELERQAEGETAYKLKLEEGRGSADADFLSRYDTSAQTVRNNIALLNQIIGTARVSNGKVVGEGAPGFSDVIGAGIPGLRFIPGTQAANFDAMHRQVMGTAFLDAFENLKGGGPISDREGQAATAARTRLDRNISEAEYIRAATELRDAMQRSLGLSDERYERVTGQRPEGRAPAAQSRATPSGAAVRNWPGN